MKRLGLVRLALVAFALLVVACTGGVQLEIDLAEPVPDAMVDGGADLGAPEDVPGPETGPEVVPEAWWPDGGIDGLADLGDTGGVVPGEAGWPCDAAEDCLEPWCIDTPDGKKCTQTCTEECPLGWECMEYPPAKPDLIFLCLPPSTSLCRPCTKNGDCLVGGVDFGDVCVDYGAAGSYCGKPCLESSECPAGYQCEEVTDVLGKPNSQCKREGNECGCVADWIDEGAYTECFEANAAGVCYGTRKCSPSGLTACDAQVPMVEECNGMDDDCDGSIDEEVLPDVCMVKNENGKCFGEEVCEDGKWACDAKTPGPELCDGVDNNCNNLVDETFPDTNGDGKADCLTDDADGDGVMNNDDNCPYVANPDQKDWDLDTIGDQCDPDDDNDQFADGEDCAPLDKKVSPGETEACDGIDNDCSGKVDDPFPDTDMDGLADCLDEDDDGDGIPDKLDCAPLDSNVAPGMPELCDGTDQDCDDEVDEGYPDADNDGKADCVDEDYDGDGAVDADDNCPKTPNPKQEDQDADGTGDACDPDDDGDFVADTKDNCVGKFNPFQEDLDEDGQGDACDTDDDGDGVEDGTDNCPLSANADQSDQDKDQLGNPCDPDADGDGDPNALDCEELDATVFHGAKEVCNQADDDCDGQVDETGAEGCASWYPDADADGFGANKAPLCLCGPELQYTATEPGDCDDADALVNPQGAEKCNGKDDNCDGAIDPAFAQGCAAYYLDADMDGFGLPKDYKCLCAAAGKYVATKGGDCNDGDPKTNPGAAEVCNGKDDDCDETVDPPLIPGCVSYFADADSDGWGLATDKKCVCSPSDAYKALLAGDCDDVNPEVNPGKTEVCNGTDDDCDGKSDPAGTPGCQPWFADGDGDGYGWTPKSACLCGALGEFVVKVGGDCDDDDALRNPAAKESCNGSDDDCDYKVDEDFPDIGKPCDGDDIDSCKNGAWECKPDGLGTVCSGEDLVKAELCNGVDDDCDLKVDEGFPDTDGDQQADCMDLDDDGDGKVDFLDNCPLAANSKQEDFDKDGEGDACDTDDDGDGTLDIEDCGPLDPALHLGAKETCNDIDDNCNGVVDDDWPDKGKKCDGTDNDKCEMGTLTCAANGVDLECVNEIAKNIPEECGGGDEDCDGQTDEENAVGCKDYYLDADVDGYGLEANKKCLCASSGQHTVTQAGDCDDGNPNINPSKQEVCGNSKDDNCNGQTDEGCITCQYMGQKYGAGDWSCPVNMRMPYQNEYAKVQPCVAGKQIDYYHGTAWQVGGCNCKWNGSWCGQPSIETFEQGRLCGDYWAHHVCVPK